MVLAQRFHFPLPGSGGVVQAGSSGAAVLVQHLLDASHTADVALAEAAFNYCQGDFEGAVSMLRERKRMVELIRHLYPVKRDENRAAGP